MHYLVNVLLYYYQMSTYDSTDLYDYLDLDVIHANDCPFQHFIPDISNSLRTITRRALRKVKSKSGSYENEDENEIAFSTTISLKQLPLALVGADELSSFICQAALSRKKWIRRVCLLFCRGIRSYYYPHTIYFGPQIFRWDSLFLETILNILFRSTPSGSWKRLLRELIDESFQGKISIYPSNIILRMNSVLSELTNAIFCYNIETTEIG